MVLECFGSLFFLNILLAMWVFQDSIKRRADLTWTFGAVLLGPIMLPMYRGRRPLLPQETRVGGPDWIVSRNFAWTWTLFMVIVVFWAVYTLVTGNGLPASASEDSAANQVRQAMLFLFLSLCWLVPTMGAILFSIVSFVDEEIEVGDEV